MVKSYNFDKKKTLLFFSYHINDKRKKVSLINYCKHRNISYMFKFSISIDSIYILSIF